MSRPALRVVFAGTPDFAAVALQALLDHGVDVPLVMTQPDRPAGRGLKLQPSAVKQIAQQHGIAVVQPRSLKRDGVFPEDAAQAHEALQAVAPDLMVVAAYGLILPTWTLQLPRLGCLNIHASLLPRWRGAAPIHRAIEAGDAHTGITLMQMDEGLDTGDMLRQQSMAIAPDETTGALHDRLAALGGALLLHALQPLLQDGVVGWVRQPQPHEGITYANKIDKSEALLQWPLPAHTLARQVRAFNPFPGAHTIWAGEPLKIWQAQALEAPEGPDAAGDVDERARLASPRVPGTVLQANAQGLLVLTGQGLLRISQLQSAGGKRLAVADWLHGHALQPGTVLGAAAPRP